MRPRSQGEYIRSGVELKFQKGGEAATCGGAPPCRPAIAGILPCRQPVTRCRPTPQFSRRRSVGADSSPDPIGPGPIIDQSTRPPPQIDCSRAKTDRRGARFRLTSSRTPPRMFPPGCPPSCPPVAPPGPREPPRKTRGSPILRRNSKIYPSGSLPPPPHRLHRPPCCRSRPDRPDGRHRGRRLAVPLRRLQFEAAEATASLASSTRAASRSRRSPNARPWRCSPTGRSRPSTFANPPGIEIPHIPAMFVFTV